MRNLAIRGAILGASVPSLPYDAELEWIRPAVAEMTYGFYADTGVDCGADVGFRIKLQRVKDVNTDTAAFGARLDGGNTRFFVGGYNGMHYAGYNGLYTKSGLTLNEWYSISNNFLNDRSAKLNGIEFASLTGNLSYRKRLYYCCYHIYSGSGYNVSSLYRHGELEISVGSEIVRDIIPVRIGSVAYGYDRITGNLMENLGGSNYEFKDA